jgi:heme oxygenase
VRQVANTLVHLNVETFAYHGSVDRFWLELVTPGHATTQTEYMRRLVRVYGFDAPVEAAIAYTPRLLDSFELAPRAGLIAGDLMTLGLEPSQVSKVRQCMVAPFATVAEAMGWLYVHQRATLVHALVRRELLARLPQIADATMYLGAYANSTGAHWDDFGIALDRIATTPALQQRVLSAAGDAFRVAVAWFEAAEARRG